MAIPGTIQTYDLATGIKLDIEDMIWLIDPFDTPLQGTYGADDLTTVASETVFEKKFEWLDENLLTPRSSIAAQALTGATYIQLPSGYGIHFQTGDVILVDSEQMYVTGYGTTADTLTVTRGFNGTTAQTVNTGDVVVGLGSALPEGSNPPSARAVDRTDRYNYTQIFGPYAVTVSGTENVVQKYGLKSTEFDHQVANRVKEAAIAQEQAFIYGAASAGSGSTGRTTGGMDSFITVNVDNSTTSLSDSALLALLQDCFIAGGSPDRLMVGPKQKSAVSGLDSSNIRYQQMTNARGQKVDYYDSDFGRLTVVLNRWLRVNNAYIFSRDQAAICTLRPLTFEMLAKTGDATTGQVVSEKGFKFRLPTHAAKFTALT